MTDYIARLKASIARLERLRDAFTSQGLKEDIDQQIRAAMGRLQTAEAEGM